MHTFRQGLESISSDGTTYITTFEPAILTEQNGASLGF